MVVGGVRGSPWDRVRCSHSRQVSLWVDGEQGWQECKKDKFESKFVKKAAVLQFKKFDTAAPGE